MKIPKLTLPYQAYENDFLPGWEVSKWHHSPEARERFERTIEEKRKIVAAAQGHL